MGEEGIKIASASITSANEPAMDLILVHTVQLKLMIKAHFSVRMLSSGISDIAFASLHSEKTRLKKLMMMMMMMMIIIMKNRKNFWVFVGRQKWTSST